MANVEKLSIALVPEMAGLDRGAVEGGDCATASEVVRAALPEWKQRRTLRQRDIGEPRQVWAEGFASGPGRFEALDAIKAEGRRRRDGRRRPGQTPGVVMPAACRSPHCSGFLSPPRPPHHFRPRGTLPISRKGLDLVSPSLAKISTGDS
jgi:antitoxin ParD1/3/4